MIETFTAGGVVLNKHAEVLVVNQNGNSWSLPKGHIDDEETALDAAKREIYEESGVGDLLFIKELGSYRRYKISLDGGDDMSEFKTILMFLFKTHQMDLKPIDPANPEARWVEVGKVAQLLTHEKDREFFESIIQELSGQQETIF